MKPTIPWSIATVFDIQYTIQKYFVYHTVDENIIATIKMQNNICYTLKMVIFLYCSPFSYRSPNFAIAKVVALNLFLSIFA